MYCEIKRCLCDHQNTASVSTSESITEPVCVTGFQIMSNVFYIQEVTQGEQRDCECIQSVMWETHIDFLIKSRSILVLVLLMSHVRPCIKKRRGCGWVVCFSCWASEGGMSFIRTHECVWSSITVGSLKKDPAAFIISSNPPQNTQLTGTRINTHVRPSGHALKEAWFMMTNQIICSDWRKLKWECFHWGEKNM